MFGGNSQLLYKNKPWGHSGLTGQLRQSVLGLEAIEGAEQVRNQVTESLEIFWTIKDFLHSLCWVISEKVS